MTRTRRNAFCSPLNSTGGGAGRRVGVVFAVLVAALAMAGASFPALAEATVLSGYDAEPCEFPWTVSIERTYDSGSSWFHSCSGVIFDAQLVLTSAACVEYTPPSSLRVVAGLYRRSDRTGTQTVGVWTLKVHEDFDNPPYPHSPELVYVNDLAILRLDTPITFNSCIQPATLPHDNSDHFVGDTAVIAGWGRTSASNVMPDTMQRAQIEVISTTEANAIFEELQNFGLDIGIWDAQLPIYDRSQNVGTCFGDSGAPIMVPHSYGMLVIGFPSWGLSSSGNCHASYPSIGTRLSYYLDWIAANSY